MKPKRKFRVLLTKNGEVLAITTCPKGEHIEGLIHVVVIGKIR
jgi:hypothetical protein